MSEEGREKALVIELKGLRTPKGRVPLLESVREMAEKIIYEFYDALGEVEAKLNKLEEKGFPELGELGERLRSLEESVKRIEEMLFNINDRMSTLTDLLSEVLEKMQEARETSLEESKD